MNFSTPASQKAAERPISFVLNDQASGDAPVSVDLVIRPEDLTRTDTSRMNVQQTLGGAWADNFGPGVPIVNIAGNTGWRGQGFLGADGETRFRQLFDQVFTQWHERREDAVLQGRDPDLVQLIFSDTLDQFSGVVAPTSFVLRRSKASPLLCRYQISMAILDQNVDQQAGLNLSSGPLGSGLTEKLGIASIIDSVKKITAFINEVNQFVQNTLVAPVRAFLQFTQQLYSAVRGTIAAIDNLAGSFISIAQYVAQAGVNIFRTLAAVASIPGQIKTRLQQIAGAYSNIFCVFKNAMRKKIFYPDYTPMFGASNCSSTAGGRPISTISGENPFYKAVPTGGPGPITITQSSNTALRTLAANDPVLQPMSTDQLGSTILAATDGMAIAA